MDDETLTQRQREAVEALEGARRAGVSLSDYAKAKGLELRPVYDAIAALRRRGTLPPADRPRKRRSKSRFVAVRVRNSPAAVAAASATAWCVGWCVAMAARSSAVNGRSRSGSRQCCEGAEGCCALMVKGLSGCICTAHGGHETADRWALASGGDGGAGADERERAVLLHQPAAQQAQAPALGAQRLHRLVQAPGAPSLSLAETSRIRSGAQLNVEQLNWLLDGYDVWRMKPHEVLHLSVPSTECGGTACDIIRCVEGSHLEARRITRRSLRDSQRARSASSCWRKRTAGSRPSCSAAPRRRCLEKQIHPRAGAAVQRDRGHRRGEPSGPGDGPDPGPRASQARAQEAGRGPSPGRDPPRHSRTRWAGVQGRSRSQSTRSISDSLPMKSSAVLACVVEPFAYLSFLFERLPHLKNVEDFEAVLPWAVDLPARH